MLVDFHFHVTTLSSILTELRIPFFWLIYCKSNVELAAQQRVVKGMGDEKTVVEGLTVEGILVERSTNEKNSGKRTSSWRHDQQKLEVDLLVVKWSWD